MSKYRKYAEIAGIYYLLTLVPIPTLTLYGKVYDPDYILGSGPENPVLTGAIPEMIVALAGFGTAVALFPEVKRQNEAITMGLVGSRTLEAAR